MYCATANVGMPGPYMFPQNILAFRILAFQFINNPSCFIAKILLGIDYTMTIASYGVWRGTATKWEPTQQDNDHGHITFTDGTSDTLDCAVDVKSKDSDSRIVFWDVVSFDESHPLAAKLAELPEGYQAITNHTSEGLGLDYLKDALVNVKQGRILSYQKSGPNNDILDFLNPIINAAVSQKADMYLYGSKYSEGDGIQ